LNLPSQKLFLVFIPIVVILGLFVMYQGNRQTTTNNQQVRADEPKVVAIRNTIINTVDTDSDGVPDWLEVIWHTDSNKDNTFGVPDVDYIKQKIEEEKNITSTPTTITNTDDLSKQLFTRYMALQQSGELNDATIQTMTADIVANIVIPTDAPYTEKNLKTFPDSDTKQLQAYVSSLSKLYEQYSSSYLSKYPNTTLVPEDPAFAKTAGILGDYYVKFSQALVAIPVPAGGANFHLAYTNAIRSSGVGLKAMESMNTEPLNGIIGFKQYLEAEDAQAIAINNLRSYLRSNGIVDITLNPF
jgi:hypothetical protein